MVANQLFCRGLDPCLVQVGEHHVGSGTRADVSHSNPDCARTAGNEHDLPLERQLRRLAELGLFEAPVLHIE